jgi:hypothetical protein
MSLKLDCLEETYESINTEDSVSIPKNIFSDISNFELPSEYNVILKIKIRIKDFNNNSKI